MSNKRPLDDGPRRKLLRLCREHDQWFRKSCLLLYRQAGVRLKARDLADLLHDKSISLKTARAVAAEYVAQRDAPPAPQPEWWDEEANRRGWEEYARSKDLMTPREALAKWNAEHPEKLITEDDLGPDDRANMDIPCWGPIREVAEEASEALHELGKLPTRERDQG